MVSCLVVDQVALLDEPSKDAADVLVGQAEANGDVLTNQRLGLHQLDDGSLRLI
jgi:hypothetical protein